MVSLLIELSIFSHLVFAPQSQPILWNMENLYQIKYNECYKNVKNYCIRKGYELLSEPDVSVTEKEYYFVDDPHIYTSLSRYAWKTDNGYIIKDGEPNPDIDKYDSYRKDLMAERLQRLSLAYFFSEDISFYHAFERQIRVWFLNDETKMYPNFEYAQVVPGRNDNKGTSSGLIEVVSFGTVLESVRLVRSCKELSDDVRIGLFDWYSSFTEWIVNSRQYKAELDVNANIAVASEAFLFNAACFLKDRKLTKRVKKDFETTFLQQIDSDGKLPKELNRTSAFSYSVYDLSFVLDFCIMAENNNLHLFKKYSSLIYRAFDYLAKFMGNRTAFPYTEIMPWNVVESRYINQVNRLHRLSPGEFINPKYKRFEINMLKSWDFAIL